MSLTKRQAIRECKKLWREIEKSGLSKLDFLETKEGNVWIKKSYDSDCPLCEYSLCECSLCDNCPLVKQYGEDCFHLGYRGYAKPSPEWLQAVYNLKE